ncbi:MAG TPA: gephyrin-like molybdotransferase Glp [Candidatus Limnocylindrales bacterium]|jgi:molybdopterin molybdotransferase|nr:gephyrin-like molybdotransferase Glp [Candidatus Limnocylindrales bacterium]
MSGDLLPVEAAQATVLAGVAPLTASETLAPEAALGRVLASPVVAAVSLPPWNNSAMDGFAVRAADVEAATEDHPVRLTVVGESRAGGAPDARVLPETAIRIATGAPVPAGADAVVPVEDTTPLDEHGVSGPRGRQVLGPVPVATLVHVAARAGNAIRSLGSDVRAGDVIAQPGDLVTPAVVALASGAGVASVEVRRRPIVAVLATGDEVRAPGTDLGPAGIPDANGPGLRALVREAGAVPLELGIATDRLDDVEARLRRGLQEADLVVVSGGVSVGPYDVVRLAFDKVGHMNLWRVAVQPGKPFAFGRADVDGREDPVLLFGLPGNPVSSFVTFELFVRPVLRRLAGQARLHRPVDRGVLEEPVSKSLGRRGYQRVTALRDVDGLPMRDDRGRVRVRLAGGQGSHVLSALAAADALAVLPEPVETAQAGDEVELRWLDRG